MKWIVSVLPILGVLLALFAAYVVGRAVGILTGIGPHPMEALAIALALGAIVWRARRRRSPSLQQ